MTRILEIRSGRIRTHDKDFGDPNYNQLNYTPQRAGLWPAFFNPKHFTFRSF